jgi:hypothetical protein
MWSMSLDVHAACTLRLDVSRCPWRKSLSILDSLIDDVGDRRRSTGKPASQIRKQCSISRTSARCMMTGHTLFPTPQEYHTRYTAKNTPTHGRDKKQTDPQDAPLHPHTHAFMHRKNGPCYTVQVVYVYPHGSHALNRLVRVSSNLFEGPFFFSYTVHTHTAFDQEEDWDGRLAVRSGSNFCSKPQHCDWKDNLVVMMDNQSILREISRWVDEGCRTFLTLSSNPDILWMVIGRLCMRIAQGTVKFLCKVERHRGDPLNATVDDLSDLGRTIDPEHTVWTTRSNRMVFSWIDGQKKAHTSTLNQGVRNGV